MVRLDVNILRIAGRYLAITQAGGITVRGSAASTRSGAYKNLLWKLSGNGQKDDDAELAVELLVHDTTLPEELERQEKIHLALKGVNDEIDADAEADEISIDERPHLDQL